MSQGTVLVVLIVATICLALTPAGAGQQQIVLHEYLNQPWTNQLLSYPFSAPEGACAPGSVRLTRPQGPVPVQLTDVRFWPGTQWVKAAKLTFITSLAPLAGDTYTVRYGMQPAAAGPATDLKVAAGSDQVEIATGGFGARLLLGTKAYPQPVAASAVPGPVLATRLGDGTWFGGSALYGPTKLTGYAAKLTENGPVLARVAVRYTYANGNTMEVTLQVAAGDNTLRCETNVKQDRPEDGFRWVLSRGLPPFVFQVQDEHRNDRPCFPSKKPGGWEEIPLQDYTGTSSAWPWAAEGKPAGLVTNLTPWEDWFGTFTQRTIRLKLENTPRELQIHSLDPGAWVEPRDLMEIFNPGPPGEKGDQLRGLWDPWEHKLLPLLRDAHGEVYLAVNAAAGVRKFTLSDCLSVFGAGAIWVTWKGPKIPPEAGPTVGDRLDEVKDMVLSWPGDEGKHPRLFISRPELEAIWARHAADPALLNQLTQYASASTPQQVYVQPGMDCQWSVGAYLLSGGSPQVAQHTQLLARVHNVLEMELRGHEFGSGGMGAVMYDAVADSPWVSEQERAVLRAEMAYYGYRLADPACWSAERGYCSGNQNMTVNWVLPQGMVACAIPEHPMAKIWYHNAQQIMEQFLNRMVGPAGEWPESMGDHGMFSINEILTFAIASSNAGFHDYVNDPRLKRLLMYQAKILSAPDPRPRGQAGHVVAGRRYIPALGRDSQGELWGTSGVMAYVTRHSDPAYSATLQWAWLQSGAGTEASVHFLGFQYVMLDKSLPSKQPDWISEVLPETGAILRHGLGTPDEHQVMLLSGDHFAAFYPAHTGSFPLITAYGKPVAGSWPGAYQVQDELMISHVSLAHEVRSLAERSAVVGYNGNPTDASMWSWPTGELARFGQHGGLANVSAFSTLPREDYAAVDVALYYPRGMILPWMTDLPAWPPVAQPGQPPVDWKRQVLFLKDDDPAKINYLLIRDSIKGPQGPQPTMWQMWTVSDKIGTPDQVKDLPAFLADKPGNAIVPAHEIKGDRFTAIGQFGVDVEYYIASPTDTPRYTLRYGCPWLFAGSNPLIQPEYQDLMYLQMPGDGAYYVAFYPRKRDWPAPTFSTLGNGLIIKVSGDFGTDYGFLSALPAAASGESASFQGTAGSVEDRTTGRILTLGAQGGVRYQQYGLAADFAASLRVAAKELKLELPAKVPAGDNTLQAMVPFAGGTITVTAPGRWTLAPPLPGVKLTPQAGGFLLQVPAGVRSVTLVGAE